jgi:hypothetical protein
VLDNGTPVVEQFMGTIQPLQTAPFVFSTLFNNTVGNHTLQIYTDLAGDGWALNDTLTVSFTTSASVNVPYYNDFESGPSTLNDFCVTNTQQGQVLYSTTAGNNSPAGITFDAINSNDWDWGSDTIPSSGLYIWNPTRSDQQYANARLNVNTAGYNSLVLEFDAKLLYQWSNENTNFRVRVNGQMITPHMQPNNQTTPYTMYRYDLSAFLPAPFITIDFDSKVMSDIQFNGMGILMDNVAIYEPDSIDAGVTLITMPTGITPAGSNITVAVNIRNFGSSTLTSIPVVYQVDNNTPVTETWSGTLAPNAITSYTFTTTFVSPSSVYNLCSWTDLIADTNTMNDSTCGSMFGMALMPVPFTDNFDGPQNFAAVTTYANSWELGNPVAPNITGTHSGPNAWEVNLNGQYANNSNEYLYSPFFDFSQITDVELRFWHWYHTDNWDDGGRVEYSTDLGNTWTVLGVQFDPLGNGWYNQSFLSSSGLAGWSGLGNNYSLVRYDLAMFDNYPNPVQFRYVFTSNGSSWQTVDGWAIDDFQLFVPIDAATNSITFGPTPLPNPVSTDVKINVRNNGQVDLSDVNITLSIDNNIIVTDPLNFSTPLLPGQQMSHQFSVPWTNAAPGIHSVKIWTDSPNGLVDVNFPNDTTTWTVAVMDTVGGYPWCNSFETGNGIPEMTTMNATRFTNTHNSWEFGTPGKNIINAAHGGTKCWITERTMNYPANDTAGLFTPFFNVDTVNCYHLEFWSRTLTPANTDGGVVEYSFDGGLTWQRFGIANEPDWYNLSVAPGLGAGYQPNFGGTTNGWVLQQHDIRFSQAGQVTFRFRFGSDNSVQSEGWAIDDICFNRIPPCVLAVEELSMDGLSMVAYPNPAGTTSQLTYNLPDNGRVTLVLRDMLGREVATFQGEQPKGQNTWTVDVSTLPEGVYFYELNFGAQRVVQKVVVSH